MKSDRNRKDLWKCAAIAASAAVAMLCSPCTAHGQCDPQQIASLFADDGSNGDQFGSCVSFFGDIAVIGAAFDDDIGVTAGSAYVFEKFGSAWAQTAKLTADDGAADDSFGTAVSVSGNVAVIGAWLDDDHGTDSGAAYIFEKIDDVWTQTAKLAPDDGAAEDYFGAAVSVFGDTVIVGAWLDDDNGNGAGSVYVFQKTGDAWPQITKLTADDGAALDYFGSAVHLRGDTAVVGAPGDNGDDFNTGSAYVFRLTDGVWTQTAKLTADDGTVEDRLGTAVTLGTDIAVIGALGDDNLAGAAYVFRPLKGVWTQTAKLVASSGGAGDRFGESVSVTSDGATAVIGAPGRGSESGTAYVFEESDGSWSQTDQLIGNNVAPNDNFGGSVSIVDDRVLIGAKDAQGSTLDAGSAYLFALDCVPAFLTGCTIDFGSTDNPPCDVATLVDDDDVDQILRSQFGFTIQERNLTEIAIHGTWPGATKLLLINTRESTDTPNVIAKIKAMNYATNEVVDVGQYLVDFSGDDTAHTSPIGSTVFVNEDGDVELHLRYVAPATFTPLGFTVGIDQVQAIVE